MGSDHLGLLLTSEAMDLLASLLVEGLQSFGPVDVAGQAAVEAVQLLLLGVGGLEDGGGDGLDGFRRDLGESGKASAG